MRPHIAEMARIADTLVAAYPNAGLPNAMGQYDEQPDQTAHFLHEWAEQGLVNILGGCCGTTPDHIRHVADAVAGMIPRVVPERPKALRLSGLEPFELA
jgi:5-methyltetrahydrofolate--homocysteine methyltransferase